MPDKKVRLELKNMIIEESLQPGWVSKAQPLANISPASNIFT